METKLTPKLQPDMLANIDAFKQNFKAIRKQLIARYAELRTEKKLHSQEANAIIDQLRTMTCMQHYMHLLGTTWTWHAPEEQSATMRSRFVKCGQYMSPCSQEEVDRLCCVDPKIW